MTQSYLRWSSKNVYYSGSVLFCSEMKFFFLEIVWYYTQYTEENNEEKWWEEDMPTSTYWLVSGDCSSFPFFAFSSFWSWKKDEIPATTFHNQYPWGLNFFGELHFIDL